MAGTASGGSTESASIVSPDSGGEVLKSAMAQHRAGNLGAAESLYRQTLSIDSNSVLGHSMLGLVLLQQGNTSGGFESIKRSLELNPSQPDMVPTFMGVSISGLVLIRLAAVFSELRRDAEALSVSALAVEKSPQISEAHFHHAAGPAEFRSLCQS